MNKPYCIKPGSCEVILDGFNGLVYLVSDNLVVKVSRQDGPPSVDLKKEFLIQSMIYSAGYPVPAPYGIFSVETDPAVLFSSRKKIISDGFFMERIHGHHLGGDGSCNCDFENSLLEAHYIHDCIRDRLGIEVSESYGIQGKNVMHDKIKNRTVLIDFGNWRLSDSD